MPSRKKTCPFLVRCIFSTFCKPNLGHEASNNSPAKLNFGAYYDSSGDPSVSHIALYETNGTALYGFGVATNTLVYASNRYHNFYNGSAMDGSAVVIDSTALSIVVPGDISGSGRNFHIFTSLWYKNVYLFNL